MTINYKLNEEFLVDFFGTVNQWDPAVAVLSDGRIAFTWETSSGEFDSSVSGIAARVFQWDGAPDIFEFGVNSTTTNGQDDADIAALADGRFVITWENDGDDVYYTVFDAQGHAITPELTASSNQTNAQLVPTVISTANGGFVITWYSNDGADDASAYGVKARLFNPDGSPVSDEFLVNELTTSSQRNPDVVQLDSGAYLFSWITTNSGDGDGDGTAIKARLFSKNMTPMSGEFLVNQQANSNQDYVRVAQLSNGNLLFTWSSYDGVQDTSSTGVKARIFNSSGAAVSGEFLVNQQTSNEQSIPSVVALPGGGFMIAYRTFYAGSDGDGWAVMGRFFDNKGVAQGDEFVVNQQVAENQNFVELAVNADGDVVATWLTADTTQDGSFNAIKARTIDVFYQQNGTGGNDVLTGAAFEDRISGGNGADLLLGRAGDDTLSGQGGADQVRGGRGNDLLFGGNAKDTLNGGRDDDVIKGGGGADTGKGGDGDDLVDGQGGADKLFGGSGDDELYGSSGNDTLSGDAGDDLLFGGGNKDRLKGGAGDDILDGGNGADILIFANDGSDDRVMGFENGKDRLDLSKFKFASNAEAKSHFFEVGGAHDKVIAFVYGQTSIEIHGLNLGQVNGADFIL